MELDKIRNELLDRRVGMVAKATGISRVTIAAIRDGQVTNPQWDTVKKLTEYLEGRRA